VNIFTDEALQPKRITTFFQNLPLREAFNLILTSNRLFAKKVAENTVIVVPDNPGKRQQYDELMVQTFYLTDADAKVVVNLVRTILNTRQVFVNEKLNALVIRETPEKIELARKVLEANDRGWPRSRSTWKSSRSTANPCRTSASTSPRARTR